MDVSLAEPFKAELAVLVSSVMVHAAGPTV